MTIREITSEDINEIAVLHKKIFGKSHFSSTFSHKLLIKYFNALIEYNSYKFVAVLDNQIQGYLIAGYNAQVPVKRFMKQNLFQLLTVLTLNPKFLLEKILELYSSLWKRKASIHSVNVSVYLIAVDSGRQNKGIGKFLLEHFEKHLIEKRIKQYTLAVRTDNINAINFYNKNHFIEVERDSKGVSFLKHI